MAANHPPELTEALRQALQARQGIGPQEQISGIEPINHTLTQQRHALQNQGLADDLLLKRKYGHWALWFLAAQLVVMNAVFIAVGLGLLKFSEFVLQLYLGGTLLEVFGIVLVVTRYLFKSPAPQLDNH